MKNKHFGLQHVTPCRGRVAACLACQGRARELQIGSKCISQVPASGCSRELQILPVVSTLPSALVATLRPALAATRVRESHHHQVDYRLTPG